MKSKTEFRFLIRQCIILFFALSILLMFYEVLGSVTVASLGASGFIIFVMPHKQVSKASNMVFAYIFGSVVGIVFGIVYGIILPTESLWLPIILTVFRCLTVAVTVFLMVWTGYAHPPAAALTLGLVSDPSRIITAAIAIIGTLVLCLIRKCLSKHMRDLM